MPTRFILLVPALTLLLTGCSALHHAAAGPHLVYRDTTGAPTMQVDYPTKELCLRVEEVAARNAKCQEQSEAGRLHARATLWYNPPDMEVQAFYADLPACQKANSRMAQGVHLRHPCSSK
jgi:hypothetical protein